MNNQKPFLPCFSTRASWALIGLVAFFSAVALLPGCKKEVAQVRPPSQVSVITIEQKDTPITPQFVGQTASSHQVGCC